jgi:hypothetical protein
VVELRVRKTRQDSKVPPDKVVDTIQSLRASL